MKVINNVRIDYLILEDTLFINALFVEKKNRRKGLATNCIKEIEKLAKCNDCVMIITPSDLSKIALRFWLKNGFQCIDEEDNKKIAAVLNSSKPINYVFNIADNSVVELSKLLS